MTCRMCHAAIWTVTLAAVGSLKISPTTSRQRIPPRHRACLQHTSAYHLDELGDLFVGDFDNYAQVVEERAQGIDSSDEDGHEHIHCTLRKLHSEQAVALAGGNDATLACYYRDADPDQVFRLRVYMFSWIGDNARRMELFRPRHINEAHALALDLPSRTTDDVVADLQTLQWDYIAGCDIVWKSVGDALRGEMRNGEARIASQSDPSKQIVIKDTIELTRDKLYVNDRAYNGNGILLYGSRNGIPYKLDRVKLELEKATASIAPYLTWGDSSLRWTLGANYCDSGS